MTIGPIRVAVEAPDAGTRRPPRSSRRRRARAHGSPERASPPRSAGSVDQAGAVHHWTGPPGLSGLRTSRGGRLGSDRAESSSPGGIGPTCPGSAVSDGDARRSVARTDGGGKEWFAWPRRTFCHTERSGPCAAADSLVSQQVECEGVLPGVDILQLSCPFNDGPHHFLAGRIAQGVDDTVVAMTTFATQCEAPFLLVERAIGVGLRRNSMPRKRPYRNSPATPSVPFPEAVSHVTTAIKAHSSTPSL